MMAKQERTSHITITLAARRAGLDANVVRHCVELGLVDRRLTEDELAELRRVRRLTELGVNLAGVEIILRMRRRIKDLQAERARLEALVNSPATRETADADHFWGRPDI